VLRPLSLALAFALAAPAHAVPARTVLDAAGSELLAEHVRGPGGGWAWRSAIQAPHLQTDRDVGAAGVAMGLLGLYETTRERRYLRGAEHAADWLLAVAQPAQGGLSWPDYHDPGRVDDTHFTSFDDGEARIADLLWRVGEASGRLRYRRAALAGLRWLEARAVGVRGVACPPRCRWRYYDHAEDYETGIGEGQAGIVDALDVFARRLHSARLERYATAGATYLEQLITPAGALPERVGRHDVDTGFLSGAAGVAFTFLSLYRHSGDARWAYDARRLLDWVEGQADRRPGGGLAWPIEAGGDPTLATGFEEGAAGIGWVELQAWRVLGDTRRLRVADAASDWLLGEAAERHRPGAWPEDLGRPLVHTSLNNGAPGIGWFLDDVARATGSAQAARGALAARAWLLSVARPGRAGVYWFEHRARGVSRLPHEPSWHWGAAGIAAFLARLSGWRVDMPGMEPGLQPRVTATTSDSGGSATGAAPATVARTGGASGRG